MRRDRRPGRRPQPAGFAGAPAGGGDGAAAGRGDRPAFRRDRFPQPEGGSPRPPEAGGAPRGERRSDHGPRAGGPPPDYRPYLSPYFDVAFYAEDNAFGALVKAVRASCHTYELFEIARVVLAKPERFVVVVGRKPGSDGKFGPLFVTPVDGLPFENEDEAVQHVLRQHLDKFFTISEVEIEPPKGNFQFVCRCGFTGELLGPPNYHRYQSILQQHHAARLAHMPFERFRERLENVKDPEVVNQWLEKMKKGVRYTWKAAEGATPLVFDSLEDARTYLLTEARDKVVRSLDNARFPGRAGELMTDGEIRAAIEGQLERQRRFPLDTANSLRGRLRREGFTIFKRGAKGVSYVCAVKRKFRLPGQTFSESLTGLLGYIEQHAQASVKALPEQYLGIKPPEAAVSSAETPVSTTLPPEEDVKLKRLWMDLRWLVMEGYVTEYSDGTLFAPPPMTPQQQKSEEASEETSAPSASASPTEPPTETPLLAEVPPAVQPTETPPAAATPTETPPAAGQPPVA